MAVCQQFTEENLFSSRPNLTGNRIMREKVRLISSAKTGYSYYTTKNKQKQTDKIQLKKYDPVVRKHVLFTETKMPSHSKK